LDYITKTKYLNKPIRSVAFLGLVAMGDCCGESFDFSDSYGVLNEAGRSDIASA
jgi:hypothetical protein